MEQYLLTQDVIQHIQWYIHNLYNMDIDYEEAMDKIQTQLKRLEILISQPKEPEQPEEEMFLLTKTNFGPAAYLHKVDEQRWQVITEDDAHVTGGYLEPKMALDEFVTQCESDDFIDDFIVGVEDGTCEFGDNNYALYVEKCFNSYVFGKEL